ncbi:MAG TPA: cobalamin biosynthesis protein CbiG [Desulfobacterales bacterium]|nr:cobalamin biosynthesis protein CbiG [Desulfobacterales bacterium]HIP40263.1 cobalamin biosynthesis protein CbiG [Desulfocapsa sulfexigens]
MKIVIIALTDGGKQLADRICAFQSNSFVDNRDVPVFSKIADIWQQKPDAIICIMATGIVVRALSTLCRGKGQDPCVLVLDEKGKFVISFLSGHLGGGNKLATEIAEKLGAQAVITTASDVTGHTALDLWAKKNQLYIENSQKLTEKSAKLVNNGSLKVFSDVQYDILPHDFKVVSSVDDADIIISARIHEESTALLLSPRIFSVGLGCNRGTKPEDFQVAVSELFNDEGFAENAICNFASIDLKSDEQGMLDYVAREGHPINFYAKEQLNSVENVSSSAVVLAATGAKGVAEPAAVLAAETEFGPGKLIVRKRKWKDVTAAVAIQRIRLVA